MIQWKDGTLGVDIFIDDKLYTTLKSDVIPKSLADIKHFEFCVTGYAQVYIFPNDNRLVEPHAELSLLEEDREKRRLDRLAEKVKEEQTQRDLEQKRHPFLRKLALIMDRL